MKAKDLIFIYVLTPWAVICENVGDTAFFMLQVFWVSMSLLMNRNLTYSQVTNSGKTSFRNNLTKVKWRLTPRKLVLFIKKWGRLMDLMPFHTMLLLCENVLLLHQQILYTSLIFHFLFCNCWIFFLFFFF